MIRIVKPNTPDILINRGANRTESDCRKFDKNRSCYISGKETFDFNRNIYRAQSVKQSLKKAQYEKCCFCEGKFSGHSRGNVEHFRPKGAVKQDKNSNNQYPGYYWLAYCWYNLYWSCPLCNQKKSTLFPLENPNSRARSHHDDVTDEKPLLIDPGGTENPRSHIKFVGPRAHSTTKFGKKTIETVDLNRIDLLDDRQRLSTIINMYINVFELTPQNSYSMFTKNSGILLDAFNFLKNSIEPTAEYSSMATNLIPKSMLKYLQN